MPAGAKRVTWTFTPPGVKLGAVVSLVALLALLGVALVPWRRARRVAASAAGDEAWRLAIASATLRGERLEAQRSDRAR